MAASPPDLTVEMLAPRHERAEFASGVEILDRYLRTQASQDVRRKANGVFVLIETAKPAAVLGCYTLCAAALKQGDIPDAVRKHLPRYPQVSATLIGRLAVSQARQGEGLGGILIADAVRRAYVSAATVGSSMLVVDALNDRAAAFYAAHGFVRLPDSLRLILPMRTIERLFQL